MCCVLPAAGLCMQLLLCVKVSQQAWTRICKGATKLEGNTHACAPTHKCWLKHMKSQPSLTHGPDSTKHVIQTLQLLA